MASAAQCALRRRPIFVDARNPLVDELLEHIGNLGEVENPKQRDALVKSLKGEVTPQGAKNEALQILCAVLLTEDEIIIENIPDIKDVNLLINLLDGIGVDVKKINDTTYKFKSNNIDLTYTKTKEFFIMNFAQFYCVFHQMIKFGVWGL